MRLAHLLLLMAIGCEGVPLETIEVPPVALLAQITPAVCTATVHIPADGADAWVALTTALATCSLVQLDPGVYPIAVPYPRPVGMLNVRGTLAGSGMNATTIRLTGSGSSVDLVAVWLLTSGATARDLAIDMSGLQAGTTTEQTHAFYVDGRQGRVTGVRVTGVRVINPYGDGAKLVGYEPQLDGTADFRIGVRFDHSVFERCGRSGITFFGGCNDCEFDHLTGLDVYDQIFDGEGKGGGSHRVRIHHNTDRAGPGAQSAVAMDVRDSSDVEIYENDYDRSISIMRCFGCSVHDTTITQARPIGAVVDVSKEGDVRLYDLRLRRLASAGPGVLIATGYRSGTAPALVVLSDSTLTQDANSGLVTGFGTRRLVLEHDELIYNGTLLSQFGVDLVGGPIGSGYLASLAVSDTKISGPLKAAVRVAGSYAGMTSVTVRAVESSSSLRCENVASTTTAAGVTNGGIVGPLVVDRCIWPAIACSIP